jgi:plastocyanin
MRRSVSIAALAAILMLEFIELGVGQKCSAALAQEKASTAEVKVDNFSFGPASLTVAVGTTVIWTNRATFPTPWSASMMRRRSNPSCSTQTRVSLSRSAKLARTLIFARFIRR